MSPRRSALSFGIALLALWPVGAAANTAVQPEPRDPKWVQRHEGFASEARQSNARVVFLGDSITDAWRQADPQRGGKAVWDREFAPLRALNLGISGDRTQHVLWRLQHGTLDGVKPEAIVLMIGTNNTGFERDGTTPRNSVAETVAGVAAIVKHLQASQPQARVLLLAIFPRGEKPDHPQRQQVAEINRGLAQLADGKRVRFLDIGSRFLEADGTLPKNVMYDALHLTQEGYERWAAAIRQPLADLLRK